MTIIIEDLLTTYKKALEPVMTSCYNNPQDPLTFTPTIHIPEGNVRFYCKDGRLKTELLIITTPVREYMFNASEYSRVIIL